jgi:hypothetical protein
MALEDVLASAKDAMTVRRVFAEPHTQDGTTVIGAAKVLGGAAGAAAGISRDKKVKAAGSE